MALRGGDIDKWLDAKIQTVMAIDISPKEIESARARIDIIMGRRKLAFDPVYEFASRDGLAP
jgi:hypothetical protein